MAVVFTVHCRPSKLQITLKVGGWEVQPLKCMGKRRNGPLLVASISFQTTSEETIQTHCSRQAVV